MMLNSAGQWYFNADGSLNLVGNPTFKEALNVYQQIWTNGLAKPVSGWTDFTGSFTVLPISISWSQVRFCKSAALNPASAK